MATTLDRPNRRDVLIQQARNECRQTLRDLNTMARQLDKPLPGKLAFFEGGAVVPAIASGVAKNRRRPRTSFLLSCPFRVRRYHYCT